MANHMTEATGAIVNALKADSEVTGIVGQRIYNVEAPATPTWPFVLIGSPIETPDLYSCWEGSQQSIVIHAFARGPGELAVSNLAYTVRRALSNRRIERGQVEVNLSHEQTQVIRDSAEASSYHAIVRMRAFVAEMARE